MNRRTILITISLALALCACGALFGQAVQDTVVFEDKGKKEKTGQVSKETYKEITLLDAKGAPEAIPLAGVASVRYGDWPTTLASGDVAYGRADFSKALEAYRGAAADVDNKKARPIYRQYALFGIASSLAGMRKNDDAAKAFNDLLAKEPDTRFIREAHLGLVAALRAKPDPAGAAAAVKRAANECKAKALGDEFSVQTDILKANLLEDEKKWPEAHSEYSGVLKKAEKFPNLAGAARLGMGRSILNNNEIQKAQGYFADLSKSAATRYLLAGACNGLGDCSYKMAETSKKADDYRQALMWYTKASVLGFPGKGELTGEHERALFMVGCSSQALRGLFKEDVAKQFFARSADQAFRELISEYPASRYVDDANKKIKEVQAGAAEPE